MPMFYVGQQDYIDQLNALAASVGGSTGTTNLGSTPSPTGVTVTSSTGTGTTLIAATGTNAGLLLPADFTKLAGIATGATANSTDVYLLARANHTGTQSADTLTDGSTNKAFLATERTKLTGIATGATANSTDAYLLARANHTGTQSADTLIDGSTNKAFLATERTKLTGIATGATANSTDAYLLARANHTGTQSADTLVDGSTNKAYTAAEQTKLAGIATAATANSSDATLLARGNHTGTQSADTLTDGSTNKAFLATERTKLSGIATGATANSTDAYLLARANHTGSQAYSTISNFPAGVNSVLLPGSAIGLTYDAVGGTVTVDYTGTGGGGAGTTNLTTAVSPTNVVVQSDTGTDATIPLVDGTNAGVMAPADFTKLAGIATGATANSTDVYLLARANHTGTQSADTLTDGSTNKAFLATERTKLTGIATGATANSTDAYLLDLGNATGSLNADKVTDGSTNAYYTLAERSKLAAIASAATANQTDAYLLNRTNHTGSDSSVPSIGMAGPVNESRDTVASAGTTSDIWAALGNQINFTGTATVTGFPSAPQAGAQRDLICAGACVFTASSNMLIDGVASSSSITMAANDIVVVRAVSTTQFRLSPIKYDGTPVTGATDAYLLARANHTGTQSADTLTDGSTNKAFLATERTKLSGIATGATANSTDATLLARANHTGTQSADTLTDGSTNKAFLATERTKLSGIATGATANSSDATLLARSNHTGTQALSTISDAGTIASQNANAVAISGGTLAGITSLGMSGPVNDSRATVASAATTSDIWAASGNQINFTGTATVTGFPAAPQAGVRRELICAAACLFTAGANMLIDGIASSGSITMAANDVVTVRAISTTQFRLSITRYDGTAVVGGGSVSVGTSPPGSPADGKEWWDSANGRMYMYYAASSVWVEENSEARLPVSTLDCGSPTSVPTFVINCGGPT